MFFVHLSLGFLGLLFAPSKCKLPGGAGGGPGASAPAPGTPAAAGLDPEPEDDPGADDAAEDSPEPSAHAPVSLYQRALGGVRFPALSGAGPTGARPEHLRECLATRKRAVVTRLLKAVAQLTEAGAAGTLPESASSVAFAARCSCRRRYALNPSPSF